MSTFQQGDRIKIAIKDKKVFGCPGTVTKVEGDSIEVVLELWSRWGTYSKYFPLWFKPNQIEKVN